MTQLTFISLLLIQSITLSDNFIKNIQTVLHLDGDTYAIVGEFEDHHLVLFDAPNDHILRKVAQEGDGPGEARGIQAIDQCAHNDNIVAITSSGKLLIYDSRLSLIREIQTPHAAATSIQCTTESLFIGKRIIYNKPQMASDESFPIGAEISWDGSTLRTIYFPANRLFVNKDMDALRDIQMFMLSTFVEPIEDHILVVIKGAAAHHLIHNDGTITSILYNDTVLGAHSFKQIKRFGFYGHRPGPVQRQRANHNTVKAFTFGDHLNGLDYGVVLIDQHNPQEYHIHKIEQLNGISLPEEHFAFTIGESTTLLFSGTQIAESNFLYIVQ